MHELTEWVLLKAIGNMLHVTDGDDEYTHITKSITSAIDEGHSAFSQLVFFEWLADMHGMDQAIDFIAIEIQRI